MEASPRPAFELSKWYLDAVGEDGEVFIGYRANLRWRRFGGFVRRGSHGGGARDEDAIDHKAGGRAGFLRRCPRVDRAETGCLGDLAGLGTADLSHAL